jgi:hypothetical protein
MEFENRLIFLLIKKSTQRCVAHLLAKEFRQT